MANKAESAAAKSKIEKYFASASQSQRATLKKMRQVIKDSAPDAVEDFSYGMPGFKYKGKALAWYAPFKDHYSLFPTGSAVAALKEELQGYKVSKGTIQFPVDKPLPISLIRKIVRTRLKQIEDAEKE